MKLRASETLDSVDVGRETEIERAKERERERERERAKLRPDFDPKLCYARSKPTSDVTGLND